MSWYTKWLPFIYLDLDYDITLEGFQLFYFLIFFHTNMISSSFEQKTNQTHISGGGAGWERLFWCNFSLKSPCTPDERTHFWKNLFVFFTQQTYIHPYLHRFSNISNCFWFRFLVSSYQVLPKSKEWSWVTDGHIFTKRTYLGEFDLQNCAPPKLCQCPILSSAPCKQLILSKKLYQQKCACSILWRKRLPALPYKVNSRHIFDF